MQGPRTSQTVVTPKLLHSLRQRTDRARATDLAAIDQRNAERYCDASLQLVKEGHPAQAFDRAREGLAQFPDEPWLIYIAALALSRGGNVTKAGEYLGSLIGRLRRSKVSTILGAGNQRYQLRRLLVDALSLEGKLKKIEHSRARESNQRRTRADMSAQAYFRAFEATRDSFPLVNAATMWSIAGRPGKSAQCAEGAIKRVKKELREQSKKHNYWLLATLAEALLLLGDVAASEHYSTAMKYARSNQGDIASMRQNLLLLRAASTRVPPVLIDQCLKALASGAVVVCAGHMIDAPDRARQGLPRRFPSNIDLEKKVVSEIRTKLDSVDARIGYVSAANGSDILFAEQLLARGSELHVVLPFSKDDFCETSVDSRVATSGSWRQRFDAILTAATRIHYATSEPYLGDDVLFEFANSVMQGLAIQRSQELSVPVHALVVSDQSKPAGVGGTDSFQKAWLSLGNEVAIIDLEPLRSGLKIARSPSLQQTGRAASRALNADRRPREIKAMLFADVKNYSKLSEQQASPFFDVFLKAVTQVLDESRQKPQFKNTWGDGLFLAFDSVVPCADFTLRLLSAIEDIAWETFNLPKDTTLRIGLHAGPVFPSNNLIVARKDLFGSHVNRAARIEPVTTPGCAFASEQFAALLATHPGHEFFCEYIGMETLAKGFDQVQLYRLGKR